MIDIKGYDNFVKVEPINPPIYKFSHQRSDPRLRRVMLILHGIRPLSILQGYHQCISILFDNLCQCE